MTKEQELKNCPFCGHKAARGRSRICDSEIGWRDGNPTVFCGTNLYDLNSLEYEKCPTHPITSGVTEEESGNKWNQRYD